MAAPAIELRPRTVPAYSSSSAVVARTMLGSGRTDTRLSIASSGTVLWGDWTGNDVETPAVFRKGVWSLYDSFIGPQAKVKPFVRLRYGTSGDAPVTGDWNGDGRTDLGVLRGRTWYLAVPDYTTGAASTWRAFALGRRGAQPVAGDWTGRGRDSVASFHRGTWSFKMKPSAAAKTRTRLFRGARTSKAIDAAVAGDWSGSGRDGFGVVRRGSWRLLDDVVTGRRGERLTVARPKGDTWRPSPWTTAAGTEGMLCPTAAWTSQVSESGIRAPLDLLGIGVTPDVAGAPDVRAALQRAERYFLGAHFRDTYARVRHQSFADIRALSPSQELAFRGPSMSALTVAVAVATGVHDQSSVGLSEASAIAYVQYLVGSVACQHLSVTPGGWGHGSQSAHWAGLAAQAAWLVWDDLSLPVRSYVESMIRSEADDQLTIPAGYWKDRQGNLNPGRLGNTAAEESAWNSAFLELAHAMLPPSSTTRAYRAQAVQLQASAYASPDDLMSDEVVNGVALRDRLDGTNALDDGSVINHSLVHPDYMGNIQMLWWGVEFALLSGGSVTQAALTQAELVYGAFSTLEFDAGAPSAAGGGLRYAEPGGTIYRPDATDPNDMYFPDGSDWGATRRAPFVSIDAHALALGLTPAGGWPADQALVAHARGHLALGESYVDGRTYSPDPVVAKSQDRYGAREEYAASQVAAAWLALVLHEAVPGGPGIDSSPYPVPPVNNRQAPAPKPGAARLGP